VLVVWADNGSTLTLVVFVRLPTCIKVLSIFTWQQVLPVRTPTYTRYAVTFVQRAAAAEGLDTCIESLP
jgi:hypothetical protein